MNVEIKVKEDAELRNYIKEMIKGQVKSIAREEIIELTKETLLKKVNNLTETEVNKIATDIIKKIITDTLKKFNILDYFYNPKLSEDGLIKVLGKVLEKEIKPLIDKIDFGKIINKVSVNVAKEKLKDIIDKF